MKVIHEAADGVFKVDDENDIYSFTWIGTVSEETTKRILSVASKAIAAKDKINWLVDRHEQDGFTPEARVWIKTRFITDLGIELIKKTHKVAAIVSQHEITEITSSVMMDAIQKVNPRIEYRSFDGAGYALNWLTSGLQPSQKSKSERLKKLFRRSK